MLGEVRDRHVQGERVVCPEDKQACPMGKVVSLREKKFGHVRTKGLFVQGERMVFCDTEQIQACLGERVSFLRGKKAAM